MRRSTVPLAPRPRLVPPGLSTALGPYTYTVTPRYFDDNESMLPLDPGLSASVTVDVVTFETKGSMWGSRAATRSRRRSSITSGCERADPAEGGRPDLRHVGRWAGRRRDREPRTRTRASTPGSGSPLGRQVFDLMKGVARDAALRPRRLRLRPRRARPRRDAGRARPAGRIRLILDNASLHHTSGRSRPPGDAKGSPGRGREAPFRSNPGRAEDQARQVRTLRARQGAHRVRTQRPPQGADGLDEFFRHGLYVNSNHVLVFEDAHRGEVRRRLPGVLGRNVAKPRLRGI